MEHVLNWVRLYSHNDKSKLIYSTSNLRLIKTLKESLCFLITVFKLSKTSVHNHTL